MTRYVYDGEKYVRITREVFLLCDFETSNINTTWWHIKQSKGSVGIKTDKVYEGSRCIGSDQGPSEGDGVNVYDQNHYFIKIPINFIPVGSRIIWESYDRRWKTTEWPGHFCGFGMGSSTELYNIPYDDEWHYHKAIITRLSSNRWKVVIFEDGSKKKDEIITKSFTNYFYFGIQTRHNGMPDNSIYVRTDLVTVSIKSNCIYIC